jgi:hypothetical protein
VTPQPEALERLLAAVERLNELPAPVLLASNVVTPGGSPDPGSLPVPEVLDPDLGAAACARRLLSIRVARPGSLLVHRRGLERLGLPTAGREVEWTARLIKRGPGLLVPDSIAVRRPPTRRPDLAGLLRLVLSDALERREKPWFCFHLAEQALAAARGARRANHA